ncbi:MAG: amino acid ABC transporter permease [Candidatus Thermoplasmatota archaeon]
MSGLMYTLFLTFCAITFGFFIGILLALGRVYGNNILAKICILYIEVIRGTPLLVQLFIIYFGLPYIGSIFGIPSFRIILSPIEAALVGLTINSSAYQAEYLRGAVQSVQAGQMTAARSLGMSKWQAISYVILPQALRISVPSWSNEFIYLLQYSSIVYIIQVKELTAEGLFIAAHNFRYLEVFTMIAIIYLILTVISTELIDRIAKKINIPGVGTASIHPRKKFDFS